MLKKSHILILGHVPLPEDHPDATQLYRHPGRWVFDQAKALSDYSDYQITLVTLVKGASQDFEKSFGDLRVIYLRAQSRLRERTGFLWDILRLRKLIRRENPALLHAHGTEDAYGLAVSAMKIPKILTIQGLYHEVNRQGEISFFSPPYVLQKLESLCLGRFNHAIVKSSHVVQVLEQHFAHLKLDVIPNTLSEVFLDVPNIAKNITKIAFVGAILQRKGFHHIREALEILKGKTHLELHVFGTSADPNYIESEICLMKKAGHCVVLHGNVVVEELVVGLMDCNMLIAPSHAETFGNQVIEGILCNCHCIVSDDTGMADNINKYGHGSVVPQRDAEAIAKVIWEQVENGLTKDELDGRMTARTRVLETLAPEVIAHQLIEIYKKQR